MMDWILKSGRRILAEPIDLHLGTLDDGRLYVTGVCGVDMYPEQFAHDVDRDGNFGVDLNSAERKEIAEAVISCWKRWAEKHEQEV